MNSDNSKSLFVNHKSCFHSIQTVLFVSIYTLLLLVYFLNRMFRHKEIQYIEVDEVTSDITKFLNVVTV